MGAGQTADLVKALAFNDIPLDCMPVGGTVPETGNAQALYNAINTRFDIYDFSSGGGTTLAPCFSGSCPAARNVVKDVVNANLNPATTGNSCKIHNSGWQLPPQDRRFWPQSTANADGTYNNSTHSPAIDAMGLPRDLCHYTSYGSSCTNDPNGRYGNGNWAREDYWKVNHPSEAKPAGYSTMTRFDVYRWEIQNTAVPGSTAVNGKYRHGGPKCSTGTPTVDRRVLTVALVKNCASLSGGSVPVEIDDWVDMFLVEPVIDARSNGAVADSIYMEVVGRAGVGNSTSAASQVVRRDVPYLVR